MMWIFLAVICSVGLATANQPPIPLYVGTYKLDQTPHSNFRLWVNCAGFFKADELVKAVSNPETSFSIRELDPPGNLQLDIINGESKLLHQEKIKLGEEYETEYFNSGKQKTKWTSNDENHLYKTLEIGPNKSSVTYLFTNKGVILIEECRNIRSARIYKRILGAN